MAFIDDFSINSAGDIRHTSGTTRYTTLEVHRALQDLADNPSATGDDIVYISTFDPSSAVPAAGIVTLKDYSAVSGPTFNIDDTAAEFIYGGSIEQGASGSITRYSGLAIGGSYTAEPVLVQNNVKLTGYWGTSFSPDTATGKAVRIIVKTIDAGTETDGSRIRAQTRDYGNQYREASTVLGLSETTVTPGVIQNDPFNNTVIGTIAALVGISNTEGYQNLTINSGTGPQPFYSQWTYGANSQSELYEYVKWATRDNTSETLYGLNGELFRGITHYIAIDAPTGTFVEPEGVSWPTGTGQLLAIDSTTAGTEMWIQLLTGVAPSDNDLITGVSTATATVNVTVEARALGVESVLGNYTGAYLSARGVGFVPGELLVADGLTDLDGLAVSPPNQQSWTFTGLRIAKTYALVTADDGAGNTDFNQLTADGAQASGSTTFTVNETISDTSAPASGSFRVFDGIQYQRVSYDSYSGSVFTLSTTLGSAISDLAAAHITYLDLLATGTSHSFTSIYTGDFDVVAEARDASTPGEEKVPYKATSTFGAGGGGTAASLADNS